MIFPDLLECEFVVALTKGGNSIAEWDGNDLGDAASDTVMVPTRFVLK